MITLRAAILLGLCFVIVVGTRCSCCKCDEVDVKYTSAFKEMELVSLDNSGKDTASVVNNTVNRNAYAVKMVLLSSIGTLAHLPSGILMCLLVVLTQWDAVVLHQVSIYQRIVLFPFL